MSCHRGLAWAALLLAGAFSLRAWALQENTEEKPPQGDGPPTPSPASFHGCVEVLLRATARGGAAGLAHGAAAVSAVWVAEILSGSKGLAVAALRVAPLSALIGVAVGAAEGVARATELTGPGPVGETVRNGLRGAGVGARVAAMGGAAIGGAVCAVASLAIRNTVKGGGELTMAPLLAASLAAGVARMALSLAPGCMATGAVVGAVLGTVRDSRILGALGGLMGLGWYAWVGGLGSPLRDQSGQLRFRYLRGLAAMVIVAALGPLYVGSPPQSHHHLSDLVSVPLGAAMAALCWGGARAVCKALAEMVDELYGAISINTPSGPDEKLLETFR